MKTRHLAAALIIALPVLSFGQSRDDFMRQQAYAEMQRVSGEVDVLRQNIVELEGKINSSTRVNGEIESLKMEIAALKDIIAQMRREMVSQRSEIVDDLSRKIKKISAAQTESSSRSSSKPQIYKGPASEYVVVSGDNLSVISRATGVKVSVIKKVNNLKSDNLKVGQVLIIPTGE
jgi:LysM repeat protein